MSNNTLKSGYFFSLFEVYGLPKYSPFAPPTYLVNLSNPKIKNKTRRS